MPVFYGQVHGRNHGTSHQPIIPVGVKKCPQCNVLLPAYKFWWGDSEHITCINCKGVNNGQESENSEKDL